MNNTNNRLPITVALIVFGLVAVLVVIKWTLREPPQTEAPRQEQTPALSPASQVQEPAEESQPEQKPPQQPKPRPQQAPAQEPAQPPPQQEAPQPQEAHSRVVADVTTLRAQLNDYQGSKGAFPTTAQGLSVLGAVPKDAWGHDYIYSSPSTRMRESYDLFSAGPDGTPDTPDDDWGEEGQESPPTEQ